MHEVSQNYCKRNLYLTLVIIRTVYNLIMFWLLLGLWASFRGERERGQSMTVYCGSGKRILSPMGHYSPKLPDKLIFKCQSGLLENQTILNHFWAIFDHFLTIFDHFCLNKASLVKSDQLVAMTSPHSSLAIARVLWQAKSTSYLTFSIPNLTEKSKKKYYLPRST